jgi:hypothetical protein
VRKVFLQMTDDDSDLSADEFLTGITSLDPEAFGAGEAPDFVFHSVVGLLQKPEPTEPYAAEELLQPEPCLDGQFTVASAGEAYQELSRVTGGLRFPLCEIESYDEVFRQIAGDVIVSGGLACDFPLPAAPDDRQVDPDHVGVTLRSGAVARSLGQAITSEDCGADAFFLAEGRVQLCPEACAIVQADADAQVDVLLACESTVIVR